MGAQGSVANAKEDTIALFTDNDFSVDLSQHAVALDLAGSGGYLEDDALRAVTGETGREIVVLFELVDPEVIVAGHADPADASDSTWLITTDGLGTGINFQVGASTIYTATVGTGVLLVAWQTRPNPDTTGAGDALLSTFIVHNLDTSEWALIHTVAHAVGSTSTSWATHVGGYWDGSTWTAGAYVTTLRIGVAPDHSSAELAEDFVAERTEPETDDSPISVRLPVDGSELAEVGEWAGSANVGWLAAHNDSVRRAQWSPLVDHVPLDPQTIAADMEPLEWALDAPGSGSFVLRVDTLRWMPLPAGCTHAAVRVHVRCTVEAQPLRVRVYAFNRPPLSPDKTEQPQAPPLEHAWIESDEIDVLHAGAGEWLTWGGERTGLLRLPVWTPAVPGYEGTVHLALAVSIGAGSSEVAIRAWHARPTVRYLGQGLE